MSTQDTSATAAEIVTGNQYPDYDSDSGKFCSMSAAAVVVVVVVVVVYTMMIGAHKIVSQKKLDSFVSKTHPSSLALFFFNRRFLQSNSFID